MRIVRDTTPSLFGLPDDGRKTAELRAQRRSLAMQLASFADGDGTRITPGALRLHEALGWSRRKLFERLDDLKTLGFLITEGRTGERGTARRRLDLQALLKKMREQECSIGKPECVIEVSQSAALTSQSAGLASKSAALTSQSAGLTTDTTGTLTDTTDRHTNREISNAAIAAPSSAELAGGRSVMKSQRSVTVEETIAELDKLYIAAYKIVPRGKKGTAALTKLIENKRHDDVVMAFKAAIRSGDAWRPDTFSPYTDFVKRYENFVALAKAHVKEDADKLTPERLARVNAIAKKAHFEQWGIKDDGSLEHDDEPGVEDF